MKKKLERYTDEVDEAWADKAIDTMDVSATPDTGHPVVLDLEGECPRCGHHMVDAHWLVAFSGVSGLSREDAVRAVEAMRDAGAIRAPLLPAEFTVQCKCGQAHPDPLGRTGLKGCGAAWRMRFELGEEDE
jgi:hypothetical protein